MKTFDLKINDTTYTIRFASKGSGWTWKAIAGDMELYGTFSGPDNPWDARDQIENRVMSIIVADRPKALAAAEELHEEADNQALLSVGEGGWLQGWRAGKAAGMRLAAKMIEQEVLGHKDKDTETLWESDRYTVKRQTKGHSAGRVKVVDKETGYCDWPIKYNNGNLGWDCPERYPDYVRQATQTVLQPENDLREVRLQVASIVAFITETQADEDVTSWSDHLPYYISEYEPIDWQEGNGTYRSVAKTWDEFCGALRKAGLLKRLAQANELCVADALAWSQREARRRGA